MKPLRHTTKPIENGPAPSAAASLYTGKVMHARLKPVHHRFSYRVFSLLVDIDRLEEAGRQSRFFSVNRFNLASFHEKDHGPSDGTPLRPHIEKLLRNAGIQDKPDRICLLAYPRILGYVFNPLSVYFVYGKSDALTAIVYEVRNTFGERHSYVSAVNADDAGPGAIRHSHQKRFYVSPFIKLEGDYRFKITPPGRAVRIHILHNDAEGPLLAASFSAQNQPMNTATLVWCCARVPLLTVKVITSIHFQALKLWLKGVAFVRRSPAPDAAPASHGQQPAKSTSS